MRRQRGAALLVILLIVGALAAYFAISALNGGQAGRDQQTANTLAHAKEALLGFAATYRENAPGHTNEIPGFLPCPDTTNDGSADPPCGVGGASSAGRLPWKTLGLPPLRDSSGQCLWFAVSGSAKDAPKAPPFNWDSVGQFNVFESGTGTLLAGSVAASADPSWHNRPLAVIVAPRVALGGQTRPTAGASECGGSLNLAAYLEQSAISATPSAVSTVTLSSAASVQNGVNNDLGLWISSRDLFDRVKARQSFPGEINTMLDELERCLAGLGTPPVPSATNKGVGDVAGAPADVLSLCWPAAPREQNILRNWQDNLLYARPATLTSGRSCNAILIFAGERTATQVRADAASRSLSANYLEGGNATSFPAAPYAAAPSGPFSQPSGSGSYSIANPSQDVVRCIGATPPTSLSFAANFNDFAVAGTGVSTNASDRTVAVATAPGSGGGCFWYPQAIPLAGKVLRAYYDFTFMQGDGFALSGNGTDLGYGFTVQMVNNELGIPPSHCGLKTEMGALNGADSWGYFSYIFETDVRRSATHADPVENHTAIMVNGNFNHSLSGSLSTTCNGSATGCRHAPANKFEEAPPQLHKQRIEIHTGCTPGCGTCNPASHAAPNIHARIAVWSDCTQCSDVVTDLDRLAKPPTAQRCIALDPKLNTFYFGFTGGFLGPQGVTLRNLNLRSE